MAAFCLAAMGSLLPACEDPAPPVRSILLSDGAYVQIKNRQDLAQPPDSTALSALSGNDFSVEIWAAGDSLRASVSESPALFMIGNAQGENEIAIYRTPSDSSGILVFLGDQNMGVYSLPGCDWDDPEVFTHVAITYDRSTLSVYGNGQLAGSRSANLDLDVGDSDALIGADWDAPNDLGSLGNFWYGAVDEVRLWTRALTAEDVAFAAKNPDKLTKNFSQDDLDDLLGLWRFNRERQDGEEEPDGSGKDNNGLIVRGAGQLGFTSDGA